MKKNPTHKWGNRIAPAVSSAHRARVYKRKNPVSKPHLYHWSYYIQAGQGGGYTNSEGFHSFLRDKPLVHQVTQLVTELELKPQAQV